MSKHYSTVDSITNLIFIGENINALPVSDIVIVLGNIDVDGIALALYDVWKNNKLSDGCIIIFSGKGRKDEIIEASEAEKLHKKVLELGMCTSSLKIIKEECSTNILENFRNTRNLLSDTAILNATSILIITKDFATRRAYMSATAEGFPADKLHLYGTIDSRPNKKIDRNSWWLNEWPRKRVLDEVRRIGEYAEKGDLSLE